MSTPNVPVLLLTGYLGSGKTTLLNRLLTNRRGIKFAVIVNDIGEVNIDASLIQKGGIVGQNGEDDLVALQNGCICCTLKMDLVKQLSDITSTGRFDYIVIEASGICEPEPIAQTICAIPQMSAGLKALPTLDCIVTVVDAVRLRDEFGCGDSLRRDDIDDEDIENLVIQQIEFCNIILLNKISDVTPEEATRIRTIIRALQPQAEIIDCDYADVDPTRLLDTHLFNYAQVATSATWVREIERIVTPEEEAEAHGHHHHDEEHDEHDHDEHDHDHEHNNDSHGHHEHHHHHHHHDHEEGEAEEYGIGTFVYYRRRPFDLNKFDFMLGAEWPRSIIRSKGVLWFSQNNDMSYLFETAGQQNKLTEAGYWYATATPEDLEIIKAQNPDMMRDWDAEVGDRMIKLVIIGRDMDRAAITAMLDFCLA
ncbi:MAG: GTP-binding protein [Muribaculaceae bacterium]|nr:GTP-binding protein [Muribaculaceae bacterium]